MVAWTFHSTPGRPPLTSLPLDPIALAVVAFAVFLITSMKGAFGGGFAMIGIPFMALVMDPIEAGAQLALVLCVSDLVALRYWRPSTWSELCAEVGDGVKG